MHSAEHRALRELRVFGTQLERAPGVELLGDLREMPDGYAWQHFRAPDGHVYEVTADPRAGPTPRP